MCITHISFILPSPNPNTLILFPTDPVEIYNFLVDLHTSTSQGDDQLSASIINSVAHIIAEPLSIVINHSFIDAYFPDDLKIVKVIPIFKSGSKSDPSNYRPISLLNIFSKIFEKAINSRILNFLSKHNILNINQFGFRKNHSTEFALIKLTDTITSALNS
jgi:hypothetical protein